MQGQLGVENRISTSEASHYVSASQACVNEVARKPALWYILRIKFGYIRGDTSRSTHQ